MFDYIVDIGNLTQSYYLARKGKKYISYVQKFEQHREYNLWNLYQELVSGEYKHSNYTTFELTDPKPRIIQVSPFRDRIVHQAMYSVLNPIFEAEFIFDSYACRTGKGSHRAIKRFEYFWKKLSHKTKDYKKVYVLKSDIVKYFDSIDHNILKTLLYSRIQCYKTRVLLDTIIDSFHFNRQKGVPIGNLTSQLFANIYLNELDHYIVDTLKVPYYIRYMDDFVILHQDRIYLQEVRDKIIQFLDIRLRLSIHQNKTHIHPLNQGIMFLGYVLYLHSRRIRKTSYQIMMRKRKKYIRDISLGVCEYDQFERALNSWWGMMKFRRG